MLKVVPRSGTKQLCDQSGDSNSKYNERNALTVQQNDNGDSSTIGQLASDTNMKKRNYSIGASSRVRPTIVPAPPRYDSMQVEFLQLEHAKMLKSLYAEIERLQRRIFELSSAELNLASVEREKEMEGTIFSLQSALKTANDKIEALEKVVNVKDDEIKSMKRQKSVEDKKILHRSLESVKAVKPVVASFNNQLQDGKISVEKHPTEQLFRRKKVPIVNTNSRTQKSKAATAVVNSSHQQKSLERNANVEQKISEQVVATTSLKSVAVTGGSGNASSSVVTASRLTATLTGSSVIDRKTYASTTASTAVAATRKNPIRNTRLMSQDTSNALGLRKDDSKPKHQIVPSNQRSKFNSSANGSKWTKKSD